jgi:hypothetical protein
MTELFRCDDGIARGKIDQSGSRRTVWIKQFSVRAEQGYRNLNLTLPIGDSRRNRD